MEKYINNPKQVFLQKDTIKKTACNRSSFLLFKTVVSSCYPERISNKQVVLCLKKQWFLAIYGNLSSFKQNIPNKNMQGAHVTQKQAQMTLA